MDDFELIKGCISGDKKCWDAFVTQYTRLIYDSIIRTFSRIGESVANDLIDDLHNDVFIRLLDKQCKALREFEGRDGCSLASYIRTISVYTAIGYLRKLKPTISIDAERDEEDGKKTSFIRELSIFDTYRSLEKEEAKETFNQLLSELKEEEKQICQLLLNNIEPGKIAKQLGIPLKHFYVRKQRLINKLRKIAKDKKIC